MVSRAHLPVFLAAATLAFVGCKDGFTGLSASHRRAEVQPSALSLGPTSAGTPLEARVRLFNRGEGTVHATLSIEPRDAPFAVFPSSVSADSGGADITVRFLSFTEGRFQASLRIDSDGEEDGPLTVSLVGTVDPPPDCDDHNPCTLDLAGAQGCEHHPAPGRCDDGDGCTAADRCVEGACVGEPLQCDDDVECTVDQCDPVLGCVHVPRAESCDDQNPCTVDSCLPVGGCQHARAPNGSLCGAPACAAMPLCADGLCRTSPAPDGFPCEDGDPCTLGDRCAAAECRKGLGSPMGIGDPVVVAMTDNSPNALVQPTELLGLLPLGDGRVRVAWLDEQGNRPPAPSCVTTGAMPPPAHRLWHTAVDADARRDAPVEIMPPAEGWDPEAARGVGTPGGLVLLVRYRVTPACCDTAPCAAIPQPAQATVLFRVRADGGVEGPFELERMDVQSFMGPAARLPLAIAAERSSVAIVTSTAVQQRCLGACPDSVDMTLRLVDATNFPPSERGSTSWRFLVPATETALDGITDLEVALAAEKVTAVWRHREDGTAPACGAAGTQRWTAWSWSAAVDHLAQGTAAPLPTTSLNAPAVTVAAGALGPAVFLAESDVTTCDGGACDAGCAVRERVTVTQSGDVGVVEDAERPGGHGVIAALAAGSAFGRAVGVVFHDDGTTRVSSPALGPTPALEATWTPPVEMPVHPVAGSHGALVADGRAAWMGALLGFTLPVVELRAVAVVPAGCGLSPTGNIRGLPGWDAGVPDASAPDAGGGVSSTSADAGP